MKLRVEYFFGGAKEIMERDAAFLATLSDQPILHLYQFKEPSITHGCFVKDREHLHQELLLKEGIEVAARPTGGGVIFHLYDLAFSFLLPASHPCFPKEILEGYRWINSLAAHALIDELSGQSPQFFLGKESSFRFCMAHPTPYDLLIDGKKAIGAAQRRTRLGLLHQGSLSLMLPKKERISPWLVKGEPLAEMICSGSFYLLKEGEGGLLELRKRLQSRLAEIFEKALIL